MTNLEAADLLDNLIGMVSDNHDSDYDEVLSKGRDILKSELCEGAISRREAIKMFTYNYKGERIPDHDCDNFPVQIDIKTVKKMLRKLPPVTPQPKTGHWITKRTIMHDGEFYCDVCDNDAPFNKTFHFCPNCGAKMQEVEE